MPGHGDMDRSNMELGTSELASHAATDGANPKSVRGQHTPNLEAEEPAQQGRPHIDVSNYDCAICSEILLDPVVGACGHDYCRVCLERWFRVSEEQQQNGAPGQRAIVLCPQCRGPLAYNLGVCQRLKDTVETLFPEEIAGRRAEQQASALEEAKRFQQMINLHAAVTRPSVALDGNAALLPQPVPNTHPDRPTAFPVAQTLAHASGSSYAEASASAYSSWDADHLGSGLLSELTASPCLSTRSSQTLGLHGLQPWSVPSLPGSTQHGWVASTSSGSTATADNHHHHYHYHLLPQWLPDPLTLDQPVGSLSPGSGITNVRQGAAGHSSPSAVAGLFGLASTSNSGQRGSGSSTSLPPLPPCRQVFMLNNTRTSPGHDNLDTLHTPRATTNSNNPFSPHSAPIHLQRPASLATSLDSDHHAGSAVMDCFLDNDPPGAPSSAPLNTCLPVPASTSDGEYEMENDGVEHSELTFGALAGPTVQAEVFLMHQHFQRASHSGPNLGSPVVAPASGADLMRFRRSTACPSPNDAYSEDGSMHGSTLMRGLCLPLSTPAPVDGSFQFSSHGPLQTPPRPQQQSLESSPAPPVMRVRGHLAGRQSFDGSLPMAMAYNTVPGDASPQVSQQWTLQRRPSEPGCRMAAAAQMAARTVPSRTTSACALMGSGFGPERFATAIKRMREEDESAAELAGHPRRSSARRHLFVNELPGGERKHGAGQGAAAEESRPTRIQPPGVQRSGASASLHSTPTTTHLPNVHSLSAPSSTLAAGEAARALLAATASAPGRSIEQQHRSANADGEVWATPPRMRPDASDGAIKMSPTSAQLTASFFDSLANTSIRIPGPNRMGPPAFLMATSAPGSPYKPAEPASSTCRKDVSVQVLPAPTPIMETDGLVTPRARATTESIFFTPKQGMQVPSSPSRTGARPSGSYVSSPSRNGGASGGASPFLPLPSMVQRSQSAGMQGGAVPSILQLATPLRIGRRNVASQENYSRTCPNTPRAQAQVPASPFNNQGGSSALIAALMLPPLPPADSIAQAQRAAAADGPRSALNMPSASPGVLEQSSGVVQTLQELVERRGALQQRPAQPWHNRMEDKTVRSALSSALAGMFSERFREQLRRYAPGSVFLYVKAIEEHMYYSTTSLQAYADLSTLQARMVEAVDQLITTHEDAATA